MLENYKNFSRVISVEFQIRNEFLHEAKTSPPDPICSMELPLDFGFETQFWIAIKHIILFAW
jgi:hypothetical protein